MPGTQFDARMLHHLETTGFSGFVHVKLEAEWLGGLLFFQGRILEAWRQGLGGFENRAEAYRNLQPLLDFAEVEIYALAKEAIPCIAALTVASKIQTYESHQIIPSTMLGSLRDNLFSGAVVLEQSRTGQAWFFRGGQSQLSLNFPNRFEAGKLHLVTMPREAPEDILHLVSAEANKDTFGRCQHIRQSVETILLEHIGVNSKAVLEANKTMLKITDPKKLQAELEAWLGDTFAPAVLKAFQDRVG